MMVRQVQLDVGGLEFRETLMAGCDFLKGKTAK